MNTTFLVQVAGAVAVNAASGAEAIQMVRAANLSICGDDDTMEAIPLEWGGKVHLRPTQAGPLLKASDVDTLGD